MNSPHLLTPLRQLRLVNSADVYKAGVLAGTLYRLHARTEFSYLPGYLDRAHQAVAWAAGYAGTRKLGLVMIASLSPETGQTRR